MVGIRLVHRSGRITNPKTGKNGTWGGGVWFKTVITNSTKHLMFPETADDEGRYLLDGFHNNDFLIYFNRLIPFNVRMRENLQVWYGPDWKDYASGREGRICFDVDVSCLV